MIPAFPDYPSAHTANGGAASTALASFFETNAITVSLTTRTSPGGAIRAYSSLSQAAEEEGLSRIWLGYHFRTAVKVGLAMGREVGARTASHFGSVIPASQGS